MREIDLDDEVCGEAMEILSRYMCKRNPSISSALANMAEAADEGESYAVKNLTDIIRFCAYLTHPKQAENDVEVH